MGTFEHEWTVKNCGLQRAMKVSLYSDTIVPTLLPQFFLKSERLVGDGGAGTIKVTTLNPAMTGGEEKQIKERTLVHDDATGTVVWEWMDDPQFRKLQHTIKIVPCANGQDVDLKWHMEFEPYDPATPPPADAKMIHLEVINALKKYVEEHPEWP